LARFLTDLGIPLPNRFRVAIDFTLHEDLQAALSRDDVEVARVRPILDQFRLSGVGVEDVSLEFAFRGVIERLAGRWQASPEDPEAVRAMHRALDVLDILPFPINLWRAQNAAYAVVKGGTSLPALPESTRIAARLGVAVP
jgi:hypothetical protein